MSKQLDLLKAADIAPMLGVTTGRVYQLIAAGRIPAVRLGRAIRVPRRAWEAWLTEMGTQDGRAVSHTNDVSPPSLHVVRHYRPDPSREVTALEMLLKDQHRRGHQGVLDTQPNEDEDDGSRRNPLM